MSLGPFPTTDNTAHTAIIIGQIKLVCFHDGTLWMEKPDGEGTGIDRKEFETLLTEYFERVM